MNLESYDIDNIFNNSIKIVLKTKKRYKDKNEFIHSELKKLNFVYKIKSFEFNPNKKDSEFSVYVVCVILIKQYCTEITKYKGIDG